jgi:hypothetical protein
MFVVPEIAPESILNNLYHFCISARGLIFQYFKYIFMTIAPLFLNTFRIKMIFKPVLGEHHVRNGIAS